MIKAVRKRELVQMIDICRGASAEKARKVQECVCRLRMSLLWEKESLVRSRRCVILWIQVTANQLGSC